MDMELAIPLIPLRKTPPHSLSRRTSVTLSSKSIDTPADHKHSSLSFLSLNNIRTVVTSPIITAFTCASFIGSIMSYSFSPHSTASQEQSDDLRHSIPCHTMRRTTTTSTVATSTSTTTTTTITITSNNGNHRQSLSNPLKSTMNGPPSMLNCASPPRSSLSVIHLISYIVNLNECKPTPSTDAMPLMADPPVLPTKSNLCSHGHLLDGDDGTRLQPLSLKHTLRRDMLSNTSALTATHSMASVAQLSDTAQTDITTASTCVSTSSTPSLMNQFTGRGKAVPIVQIDTSSARSNKGSMGAQCVEANADAVLMTTTTTTTNTTNTTRDVMNRLRTTL